jgi:hypothetical protein
VSVAQTSVTPETFTIVDFDAAEIDSLTKRLADEVGLPGDLSVEVRVDETVPTGRTRIASIDPVVIELESGALEDPRRLRKYSEAAAARVLGRVLLQVRDLLDPGFGTPPPRDELSLPLRSAWDVYATGRLARLGHPVQKQRWKYAFRTRHGFSDEVDRAFDELWTGEDLGWDDIERLSSVGQLTPDPAR